MNRTRVVRALRIAWSVAWGIAAVLLVVLWVRSYWWMEFFVGRGEKGVIVAKGSIIVLNDNSPLLPLYWTEEYVNDDFVQSLRQLVPATKIIAPICLFVLLAIVTATVPWGATRFSLRALLLATTLLALVLVRTMMALQ